MLCQMAVGPQFQIFMSSCCFFTWPSDNFGSYPKMSSVQFRKTLFCSQLQQSKTYCTYKFFFYLLIWLQHLQYSSKWLLSFFFIFIATTPNTTVQCTELCLSEQQNSMKYLNIFLLTQYTCRLRPSTYQWFFYFKKGM